MLASQWFSCKGACIGSDPVADTVKVDVASLLASGKENVQPEQDQGKAEQVWKEEAEKQRAQQEFRRQQQKEAEDRRRAEEQARRRREEEEAERHRLEHAAAERAAAERAIAEAAAVARANEEQLRLEAQRAAEEKARRDREASQLLEAQRCEEERLAREKVNSWCKANGFGDMNSQKKSFMSGSRFPLHEAVAKNNEEMVGLMLKLGADADLKNSKGQTAQDLARKMNKAGSMDSILAKLSAHGSEEVVTTQPPASEPVKTPTDKNVKAPSAKSQSKLTEAVSRPSIVKGFSDGSKLELLLESGWTACSNEVTLQVGNQLAGETKKFAIQSRGAMYIVDFTDPDAPTQTNAVTKTVHKLRIVKP